MRVIVDNGARASRTFLFYHEILILDLILDPIRIPIPIPIAIRIGTDQLFNLRMRRLARRPAGGRDDARVVAAAPPRAEAVLMGGGNDR